MYYPEFNVYSVVEILENNTRVYFTQIFDVRIVVHFLS